MINLDELERLAISATPGPWAEIATTLIKRVRESEKILGDIVEFNDGPVEAKRPDIFQRLISRARAMLGK